MFVTKRDGRKEEVNLEKITNSVTQVCGDFEDIDVYSIAFKTVGGLYDGVTTAELDELSIQTAVGFISKDPIYSRVASRLLSNYMNKEVQNQDIHSFSQSIKISYEQGLLSEDTYNFVMKHSRKLNNSIKLDRNDNYEYYGLRIVYDRYLLVHPIKRKIIETPQYWLLRVACGLSNTVNEAIEFYNLISNHDYIASTPTLFNSGTRRPQMSSCYLLDSPMDDLRDIEKRKMDIALLSKWAGGIGLSFSRIRSSGALIRGTNGKSNGIVPFLHSFDANVAAVNQGGRRKGAACVYLETHHPDIMEFLELRDNTGDPDKRTYNLNLANWIPDLFMKRVKSNEMWSLFDPNDAPELTDLFGDEYEERYLELEKEEKYVRQISAQKVYARMMRTLAETGNGWMAWKDVSNRRCNSAVDGAVVHSSNLCTEIIEPTFAGTYNTHKAREAMNKKANINVIGMDHETGELKTIDNAETSVCNLGSINLAKYVKDGKLDKIKLRKNVCMAVKFLDRVIDKNFYPIHEAKFSNHRWRPIGLGLMGWQDLLFKLDMAFESEEAKELNREIQEEIYFHSLKTSCELAKEYGFHQDFKKTHAAKGLLQFDLAALDAGYKPKYNDKKELIGYIKTVFNMETHDQAIEYVNNELKYEEVCPHQPKDFKRWNELKAEIKKYGLRNSLLIAIAPTATISAIVGSYECTEPQVSSLFKRETLSGEFVQTNRYLVKKLKVLNLWNDEMFDKIKMADGSIQHIDEIPQEIKNVYKTVWEVKQKEIINHAVTRGYYVDQSASTNLFIGNPSIDKLSSMYMYAWENGLKTTYYLRSKTATKIAQVGTNKVEMNTGTNVSQPDLENPEICESCT